MEPQNKNRKLRTWLRLLLLIFLMVGLYVMADSTGLSEQLTIETLRAKIKPAGWHGILLLQAAFIVGLLVQIPGIVFVFVGVVVYGQFSGAAIGFGGGMLALAVNFLIVRGIGGQVLTELQNPYTIKMLNRLDRRPVKTVMILRLLFLFNPPINYALAMSSIRFRDYLLGSALGLAPGAVLIVLSRFVWVV